MFLRCVGLAFLLAPLAASAGGFTDIGGKPIDDYGFAIRGRAWRTDQDSAAQDSTKAQGGSVIDFQDDLDLRGDDFIPELSIEFRTDELAFHLQSWYANESDSDVLVRGDEAFDGRAFLQGEELTGRFQVIQTALHFEWIPLDLGSSQKIGLELGVIIGVRWTEFDARIRQKVTGERFRSDATAVLPDLGVTLNVGFLNIFELDAWISGGWLDAGPYDYDSVNAGAELRIFVDDHFYFGGGYRWSSGSLERDDAEEDGRLLEYEYHGPMVTIGVQF